MANKNYNARVGNRRDTLTNWELNNPVLLLGELAIVDLENGEVRKKYGDGVTNFKALPYDDAIYRAGIDEQFSIMNTTTDTIAGKVDENTTSIATMQSKLFIGTYAEYEIAYAAGAIALGALVVITDDQTSSDEDEDASSSTSAVLGVAVLGKMILG